MMIQDIAPSRLDNHFVYSLPGPEDTALCFQEGKLLCKYEEETETLTFPSFREYGRDASGQYLFSLSGAPYYLALSFSSVPSGYEWRALKEIQLFKRRDRGRVFAAYTAFHLWKWYETSRFCGRCGEETAFDQTERAKVCPRCGNRIYPRINPAVIVGVVNGNKLLLTRYKTGFAHNALVAGFTEIGETAEQTVEREVMEEVGLRVKNIRYYKSQPWGSASDLLMGFFCDVDGTDEIKRDDSELGSAKWVEAKDIVPQPTDDSLTNEMMKLFKEFGPDATWKKENGGR